eukprot:8086867-Pyramimonas_sp.AAC.1
MGIAGARPPRRAPSPPRGGAEPIRTRQSNRIFLPSQKHENAPRWRARPRPIGGGPAGPAKR